MMSTVMVAGAEQTSVRPVSADLIFSHRAPDGSISFAKSFSDRVESSALLLGKNTVEPTAIELPGLKSAALTKISDEVADVPGVKGRTILVPEISVHSELKSAVAGKIIQPQATSAMGSQESVPTCESETKNVELPAQSEEAVSVSSDSSATNATPAAGLGDNSLAPHVSIAGGDRPLVLSGGGPLVQKETETAGETKESSFPKKIAKPEENTATPKAVPKPVGSVLNAIAVETKPVVAEGVTSMTGQTVATAIAQQSEVSKATEVFSKTVPGVRKPSAGVSSSAVDGSVRKEAAPGTKAGVIDTETTTGADQPVAPPKPGASLERMAAVMIPGGSNGESKAQDAPGPVAALVHAVSDSGGTSPGLAPGMIVSGNMPGDLTVAKVPLADAGAHAAGWMGSTEQDVPGVVGASMDAMPHMLTATPTSLEVGIQNGTHGWLKVRAEMTDGGVVNATVSAASSAGQEMLHRELPALTAFLQEEKVAVNAIVVHAAGAGAASSNSGGGMNGEGGGQTQQKSNQQEEQRQDTGTMASGRADKAMSYPGLNEIGEDGLLASAGYAVGGSWLNVRA
jgi:hypothetical protein